MGNVMGKLLIAALFFSTVANAGISEIKITGTGHPAQVISKKAISELKDFIQVTNDDGIAVFADDAKASVQVWVDDDCTRSLKAIKAGSTYTRRPPDPQTFSKVREAVGKITFFPWALNLCKGFRFQVRVNTSPKDIATVQFYNKE